MHDDERGLPGRAAAGDREAFDELVRKYQGTVYNFAYYVLGDPEDARDIVQETFLRAYMSLGKYNARYAVYTWLVGIARNLCRKAKRARRTKDRLKAYVPLVPGTQPGSVDRTFMRLWDALQDLSRDQRMAVVLRVHERWTHAEIAAAMGTTEGNVKVIVFRAYEKMREYLKEHNALEEMG